MARSTTRTEASTANIVGAFALSIVDEVREAAETEGDATATAALIHLSKYPGQSIDQLREPLQLSHSGCVRLVDRLEGAGFVARRKTEDARRVAVHVTARGLRVVKASLAGRQSVLASALEDLTPEEQTRLAELLTKVMYRRVRDERHALQICRLCDYANCPDATCPVGNSMAFTSAQPKE